MTGFVRQPEEGELVWALGALVNGKAVGRDTEGLFELLEHTGPEGYASPVHAHVNEAEAFYILEGQVYMIIGEEEFKATAGSFAYVPAKEKHAFRVDSPTAKFLMAVLPARLMPFFEEIGEPALSATIPPPPPGPPDLDSLVEAATRHGMEVLGPPPGS
ncbi:MAG: cupin domain-containing protein [Acidimicrobiia bacterium]